MKTHSHIAILLGLVAGFGSVATAQQTTASSTVPRLVSFGGVIKDGIGNPVSGPVPVTFSLFAEQEGGKALWSETQAVDADAQGHYAVNLGATNTAGLPLYLFTTGAARWLAIQTPEQPDQPRVLLVGVPYALKAADADTLGGKLASAFITADSHSAQSSGTSAAAPLAAVLAVTPATAPTGSGTTDYIPLWTSSTNLGNSILFQSGNNIGIGTTTPSSAIADHSHFLIDDRQFAERRSIAIGRLTAVSKQLSCGAGRRYSGWAYLSRARLHRSAPAMRPGSSTGSRG